MEHLLPLKAGGLFGLRMSSTHSLPYFGNGRPFFDQVFPKTRIVVRDVPVATVGRVCQWRYPKARAGRPAGLSINPRLDGKLNLSVTIAYEGLGELTEEYSFPDDELLLRIAKTKSQGWPPSRRFLSKAFSWCGMWEHHDRIGWPGELVPRGIVLQWFADHRAFDLLSVMCSLMNGAWLSADVISICGGHESDLGAGRLAQECLVQVPV